MNNQIKPLDFNDTAVTIIQHNHDVWMTGDDIGEALGYAFPRENINKIFERNRDELDEYSVEVKMTSTDGKKYLTRVYNEEGVMLISLFSKQPKAVAFRRWAVKVLKSLRNPPAPIALPQTNAQQQLEVLKRYTLRNNKRWQKILYYKGLKLNHAEIAKIVGLNVSTVRANVRQMEACGLIARPYQLDLFGGAQ